MKIFNWPSLILNVLQFYNYYGLNVFELWGPVLQGIHQVCGFATSAKNSHSMGLKFALYMTGLYPLPALTIMESWFRAGLEHQPSNAKVAVFYGTNSTNPFQPQLDDPINDHAKGFGWKKGSRGREWPGLTGTRKLITFTFFSLIRFNTHIQTDQLWRIYFFLLYFSLFQPQWSLANRPISKP